MAKKSNQGRIDPDDPLWQQAERLHRKSLVIDTHCDLPMHMLDSKVDMGRRRRDGHVDLPRMRSGGLDVLFMAIFIAGKYANQGGLRRALEMIDRVYQAVARYPQHLVLASTPADLYRAKTQGQIALVLALEGGHALEESAGVLRMLQRIGVRYVTLTHINTNSLTDSSTDMPRWHGLSRKGKALVREMNRLGVMVDVSHISDEAFWDVLEVSSAPVLASHSSVRTLAPSPRNLDDAMIRALAERHGLVQLNFGSAFLHPAWSERGSQILREIRETYDNDISHWFRLWAERNASDPLPAATIADLVAHIDHVATLVGPQYVGLGSDYDGIDHLPDGIEDVSLLPNITYALLKRGYAEADVRLILGENLVRVWQAVEREAAILAS